jgi:hypothetical protein
LAFPQKLLRNREVFLYSGKRILLIAPIFFGYEVEICAELERLGFIVDQLPDRPFSSQLMRGLTTISPLIIQPLADIINNKRLNDLGASNYDFILIVNGQTVSRKFIRALKADFPRAKFLLYMWDSFGNRKSMLHNLRFFDGVSTFDDGDAKNYGVKFRPLFYSRGFKKSANKNEIDISFVGTIHSDRYQVLSKFKDQLPAGVNFYTYKYLQALWVFYYYRIKSSSMRGVSSDEFEYVSLSKGQLHKIFIDSKAILDIEHPQQSGLTMRTFETLGSEKKLITTNANVIHYDFYDSNNICVIDRLSPKLPESFLSSEYKILPVDIYYKYSIEGWISDLLEIK